MNTHFNYHPLKLCGYMEAYHAQVQKPYTHLANPYERPYVECDGP